MNWLEQTPYRGMYRGHGLGGNEVYPAFSSVPIEYTGTHWIVEESIDFLRQRDEEAPFFMWTSFEAPHPPFDPPESFVRLYDDREISDPVTGDWNGEQAPEWVRHRRITRKLDQLDKHLILSARKHYYAMITHIDYELGRLFGELKSQGLWDNTVIIFASDHGEMLGDHGLFHKSCFYDPSARVPLIYKPAKFQTLPLEAGSVCEQPVLLADLYPTITELAGCTKASDKVERESQSLIQSMSPQAERKRTLFGYIEEEGGFYMATDGAWKYIYYAQDQREQLFHLEEDHYEQHDLAMAAETFEIQQMLKKFRCLLAEKFNDHDIVDERMKLKLSSTSQSHDDSKLREKNPFAWRGPIRYGGHW